MKRRISLAAPLVVASIIVLIRFPLHLWASPFCYQYVPFSQQCDDHFPEVLCSQKCGTACSGNEVVWFGGVPEIQTINGGKDVTATYVLCSATYACTPVTFVGKSCPGTGLYCLNGAETDTCVACYAAGPAIGQTNEWEYSLYHSAQCPVIKAPVE